MNAHSPARACAPAPVAPTVLAAGRIVLSSRAACSGSLALVDEDHPWNVPDDALDLVPADRPLDAPVPLKDRDTCKTLLERRAAAPLDALMRRLGAWGRIVAVSGWRSRREQQAIWDDSLLEHGLVFTRSYVAQPGCSEHHTGLAIDLGFLGEDGGNGTEGERTAADLDFIRPAFPYEGICRRFRELAAAYGFIERYPAGKEAVTGIAHEPWHFRYVGRPHASLIAERGLALEEYLELLDGHATRETALVCRDGAHAYAIWRVAAQDGPLTEVCLGGRGETGRPDGAPMPHAVSGDNRGGFVVTQRLA